MHNRLEYHCACSSIKYLVNFANIDLKAYIIDRTYSSNRDDFEMKRAFITGITGQDGSYLAELLLSKGYEVHGMTRRSSTFNTGRIDHICVEPHEPNGKLFLHYGDLSDSEQITHAAYNWSSN